MRTELTRYCKGLIEPFKNRHFLDPRMQKVNETADNPDIQKTTAE